MLPQDDPDAAPAFYRDTLGFEVRAQHHEIRMSTKTQQPAQSTIRKECVMPYSVDFNNVSTVGLESSPVAPALAGLRAHELATSRTSTTTSSR